MDLLAELQRVVQSANPPLTVLPPNSAGHYELIRSGSTESIPGTLPALCWWVTYLAKDAETGLVFNQAVADAAANYAYRLGNGFVPESE